MQLYNLFKTQEDGFLPVVYLPKFLQAGQLVHLQIHVNALSLIVILKKP
jgi:hypothetical protein